LAEFIDDEDRQIIIRGIVYLVGLAVIVLALAALAGLAWTVLRLTGGL
jgi:hypothetical protein